jgi:hypothetical protein
VSEAVAVVVVVPAEEIVQLTHDMVGLVSGERVVHIGGQVPARAVDRPVSSGSGMCEKSVARDGHLEVVARERRRGHPVVVGLLERGGVVPENLRLEVGTIGGQADLHAPVGAGRKVHRPNEAAHTPIGVLAQHVIDGCGRGRRVADHAEVELDPARGPRTTQRDVPELHHLVAIDELVARPFHDGSPHLPTRLGEYEDLDEVVLQVDDVPFL